VGSVRVGLAACDPHGMLATPVTTLARDEPGRADIGAIAAAAREREAIEVVVGLPRSLSGREGPAALAARSYAGLVAQAISPVPVRLVDERLSTVSAQQALRGSGVGSRKGRAVIDQVAAVVILQHALDTERASGAPAGELVPAPG
jgi:putative Holliday junction resolvase